MKRGAVASSGEPPEGSPEERDRRKKKKVATFLGFTIFDLVVIALMAALGIASKGFIYPFVQPFTMSIGIPAGTVAGGIYMLWLVLGRGITGKDLTATFISATQSVIAFFGVAGKFGAFNFLVYIPPGIACDLSFFLLHRSFFPEAIRWLAFPFAGCLSNIAGVFIVNNLIFSLMDWYLVFVLSVGGLSGIGGGVVALMIYRVFNRVFPHAKG